MMTKYLILIIIVALIAVSLIGGFFFFTPQLTAFYPSESTSNIAAGTKILFSFSRPVEIGSLKEHLVIKPSKDGNFQLLDNSVIFTPKEPWQSGETVTIQIDKGVKASGFPDLKTDKTYTWSFSIRQPQLAYLYPASGGANIYSIDIKTDETQALTHLPAGVLDYDVNQTGTAIYLSAKNGEGGSNIYMLDLSQPINTALLDKKNKKQSPPKVLTTVLDCGKEDCRNPKVSPSGEYLAFERIAPIGSEYPTYPQVWYVTLNQATTVQDDEEKPQITVSEPVLAAGNEHQTMFPDWSSENILVFYDSSEKAFIFLNPKYNISTKVSNDTGQPGSWHPNGYEYIAPQIIIVEATYTDEPNNTEEIGSSHLLLYNLKENTTTDLTLKKTLEDTWPAYSHDGKLLAFARKYLDKENWTPGRQIWLMQHNSRQAYPITNEPLFNHYELSWSPTDKLLSYVRFNQSTLTDPPEVWVINIDTTIALQIQKDAYSPQWIP